MSKFKSIFTRLPWCLPLAWGLYSILFFLFHLYLARSNLYNSFSGNLIVSLILYIPYYLFILLPYLLMLALGMHLDFGQFSVVMIVIDFALFYFLGRFLMRIQSSTPSKTS